MARTCAYCGAHGPLTREHIWPKGIIDRVNYNLRLTGYGKVISGEMTIANVCANCNNGPLSTLDKYACELYDQYFYQFHDSGSSIEFHYDWWQLGNWLLKASYNAARAARNQHDTKILARCTDFIRGVDKRQPDLAIWVDLVEPSYVMEQAHLGVYPTKKLNPSMVRFAKIKIPNTKLQHYTLRVVAINSFYFYLAIPVRPYMTPKISELAQICKFYSLMNSLDSELTVATVRTTGLAVHNIILPHFRQNKEAYRSYMKSQKDA